jgi:hypothetical protein
VNSVSASLTAKSSHMVGIWFSSRRYALIVKPRLLQKEATRLLRVGLMQQEVTPEHKECRGFRKRRKG